MSGSTAAAASDCNMKCSGNSAETCGGSNRLNIYTGASLTSSSASSAAVAVASPSIVPAVGSFSYQGCWTEATGIRALSSDSLVNYKTMTVELCAAFCSNYAVFGVEYAGEVR